MINLIPNEQKKMMVRNFYYRLGVVTLFGFGLTIVVGVISMIPSYILVSTRAKAMDRKLETQKKEIVPLPDKEIQAVVKSLNSKLSFVEDNKENSFLFSRQVIDSIVAKKMANIKIIGFIYENDPVLGRKVTINGIAPSREVLLSFRLALENDLNFKQVDLPISNFVKGSNIRFSLSLISRTPSPERNDGGRAL